MGKARVLGHSRGSNSGSASFEGHVCCLLKDPSKVAAAFPVTNRIVWSLRRTSWLRHRCSTDNTAILLANYAKFVVIFEYY